MTKKDADGPIFGYYIVGKTFDALMRKVKAHHLEYGVVVEYKGQAYGYLEVLEQDVYLRPGFQKIDNKFLKDKSA